MFLAPCEMIIMMNDDGYSAKSCILPVHDSEEHFADHISYAVRTCQWLRITGLGDKHH